ncbi:PKD domain-containing protein [bacterium]|nr:PKD domain-containing protein [bacterium]
MKGLVGKIGVGILVLMLSSCGGNSAQPDITPQQQASGTVRDISAELSRLAELQAPEGTDSAQFQQLKDELRRILEQYADGKVVSKAPGTAHGKVDDFSLTVMSGGAAHMEWTYFNRGDYDQNSEVNVSDLTPVGRWLGSNPGSAEWDKASVADGDRNNEVNLADVTPIGQNFLMSVKGYRVLEAASSASTDWNVVKELQFSEGETTPGNAHQRFTYELGSPQNDMWYCVAPFNGDGLGAPSEPVQYKAPKPKVSSVSPLQGKEGSQVTFVPTVSGEASSWHWEFGAAATPASSDEQNPLVTLGAAGIHGITLTVGNSYGTSDFQFQFLVKQNAAPLAFITPSPAEGSAPLSVILDAGASSDSDGSIVSYEWDFDGDGNYETQTGALEPSASHTYTENGEFHPVVRVTDDSGKTGTQSTTVTVKITVEGKWNLMVWIAADNNLASEGVDDIEELEQFGSDENVNILVGYDIDPAWLWNPAAGTDKVHFIKVVQDSTPYSINTTGDPANQSFPRAGFNSADPAKVRQFVDWCNTNFEAEHSCLVLWDHGNGWRLGGSGTRSGSMVGPLPDVTKSTNPLRRDTKLPPHLDYNLSQSPLPVRQSSGVLSDDSDGPWDITSNGAIVTALNGLHFDMIAFDACNMGHVESLYEYTGLADWLVASEILVPGPGYSYNRFLQHWTDNFPAPAEDVGKFLVDGVIEEYGPGSYDVTHAVFNSGKLNMLVDQLAGFASAVTANATAESSGFQSAMFASFEPIDGDGVRDLQAFLDNYAAQTSNSQIDGAIVAADGGLGACQSYFRQSKSPGSQGLAIYLPSVSYFTTALQNEYAQLPFNSRTNWLEMLQAIGIQGGGGGGIQLDWEAGDRVEISWPKSSDDMDLWITEPDGYPSGAWEGTDLQSTNLTASGDSADIGPYEWLKLKNGADSGPYVVDITFWDSFGFDEVQVTVRLYDSSGSLKEEIGIVPMYYPGYWTEAYCTLTLN